MSNCPKCSFCGVPSEKAKGVFISNDDGSAGICAMCVIGAFQFCGNLLVLGSNEPVVMEKQWTEDDSYELALHRMSIGASRKWQGERRRRGRTKE